MPNGGLLSQFFRLSQQNEPVHEAPLQDGQQLQANFQNLFYQNTRDWLVVDWRGSVYFAKVDKYSLVQELGVPHRDLRMLDPMVPIPYPSSLFIRERCIVVNFMSIKMLICRDKVYVLSVPTPGQLDLPMVPDDNASFVKELVLRIQAGQSKADGTPLNRASQVMPLDHFELPYELRALECALSTATRMLSRECADLEADAAAPLERLSRGVNNADLESVRHVKMQMNRMMTHVRKMQVELEKLLDDDEDMADMYLSRRQELADAAMAAELARGRENLQTHIPGGETYGSFPLHNVRSEGLQFTPQASNEEEIPSPATAAMGVEIDAATVARNESLRANAEVLKKLEELTRHTARSTMKVDPHDIEACEALLESYFMQVDFLMSGLNQLKERIDDTEDLIEIALDSRRNEIVSLNLLVTITTSCLTVVAVVAGIFGMNLNPLPISTAQYPFWIVIGSSCGVALILFITIVMYANRKGLFSLSTPFALQVTHYEKMYGGGLVVHKP